MKCLLIQPPSSSPIADRVFMHEPLALEYLGAGLRADGHEVWVHDARIDPDIDASCRRRQPDLVGITGYTAQLGVVKEVASRTKALLPAARVVVGGHHATVEPEDFNAPQIDLVVIGEGVQTLREIASALSSGSPLEEIAGLAIPGTPMRFSRPRRYTDLDELPLPDRSLTAQHRHLYFSEWMRPLASVRTSVGCPYRCVFCALWSITGGRYLRRDPQRVVEELRRVDEPNVFLCDDESMCDVARMEELADRIAAAGIRKKYFLYARVDTILNRPGLFAKWRRIGLSQVFVGLEFGTDERLQAVGKGITTEQQARAVRVLEELGILLYASFIVSPDFTREDFRALRRHVRDLGLRHASFAVLTPLPGTQLHREHAHQLRDARPEHFDFLHALLPTTLPEHEFYDEFARLYEGAIPARHGLRTLARYGPRRWIPQLKLMRTTLAAIRQGDGED